LKLPKDTLNLVPDLVDRIRQDCDIRCAILFGSAATGSLKPLSDIERAVLLSHALTKEDLPENQHLRLKIGVGYSKTHAALIPKGTHYPDEPKRTNCKVSGNNGYLQYHLQNG